MDSASIIPLLLSFGFPPEEHEEAIKWINIFSTAKESIMCVLLACLQLKETFSFPRIKALRVAIVLYNTGYPDFGLFPTEFSSQPWSKCEKTSLVEFLTRELTPEEFQRFMLYVAATRK